MTPAIVLRPLSLALALALGLSACSKNEPAPAKAPAATAAPAAPSAEAVAAAAAAAKLAALSPDELRAKGKQALSEQRLYAPAGDNAMEYYLALRNRAEKPDVSAESALIDLQPYAVIAAEQAIGRADFFEADRLRGLIEKADPQAPSLQRIADAIVKAKQNAERQAAEAAAKGAEDLRLAEQARLKGVQDTAAQAAAARQAASAPVAAPVVVAPTPPAALPPPAPVAAPVAAAPAAAAPARSASLVAVSTPQPGYPAEALRAGITGEVEVEISVAADGSVSEVRVLRASPRNTFERGVQSTVRRWKFQPISAPTTIRRTFSFKQ